MAKNVDPTPAGQPQNAQQDKTAQAKEKAAKLAKNLKNIKKPDTEELKKQLGEVGDKIERITDPTQYGNLGVVIDRNLYYQEGYRLLLKTVLVEAIVILGLLALLTAAIKLYEPRYRFFATQSDGRAIELVALNQPNLSQSAVLSWATQAATDIMTFGFHDYQLRLQDSRKYFTNYGWREFDKGLNEARIIETVTTRQQVITSVPSGTAVIEKEGDVGGVYTWIIKMPMTITFTSGRKSIANNWMVTLRVRRVSMLESENGLGIEQWIAG